MPYTVSDCIGGWRTAGVIVLKEIFIEYADEPLQQGWQ
jgi:hypothetical protein